jgi:hypothetical protein
MQRYIVSFYKPEFGYFCILLFESKQKSQISPFSPDYSGNPFCFSLKTKRL